jgi:hypothetical protein
VIHRRQGDKEAARAAFETYLSMRDDAEDRLMIEAYINETE